MSDSEDGSSSEGSSSSEEHSVLLDLVRRLLKTLLNLNFWIVLQRIQTTLLRMLLEMQPSLILQSLVRL